MTESPITIAPEVRLSLLEESLYRASDEAAAVALAKAVEELDDAFSKIAGGLRAPRMRNMRSEFWMSLHRQLQLVLFCADPLRASTPSDPALAAALPKAEEAWTELRDRARQRYIFEFLNRVELSENRQSPQLLGDTK